MFYAFDLVVGPRTLCLESWDNGHVCRRSIVVHKEHSIRKKPLLRHTLLQTIFSSFKISVSRSPLVVFT